MAVNNWDNSSGDGLASTAANWSLGAIPGSGDEVRFDSAISNTDCNWDISATVSTVIVGFDPSWTSKVTMNGLMATDGSGGVRVLRGELDTNGSSLTVGSAFETLSVVGPGILTAGSSLILVSGNINMATGTFNRGTSNITMSGTSATLTLGTNSDFLHKLRISGSATADDVDDQSLVMFNTLQVDGPLSLINGTQLFMSDNAIGAFINNSTITVVAGWFLTMETTTAQTFTPGIIGGITPIQFDGDNSLVGNAVVTLGGNFNTTGDIDILSFHASNTVELNTATFNLSCAVMTIASDGLLKTGANAGTKSWTFGENLTNDGTVIATVGNGVGTFDIIMANTKKITGSGDWNLTGDVTNGDVRVLFAGGNNGHDWDVSGNWTLDRVTVTNADTIEFTGSANIDVDNSTFGGIGDGQLILINSTGVTITKFDNTTVTAFSLGKALTFAIAPAAGYFNKIHNCEFSDTFGIPIRISDSTNNPTVEFIDCGIIGNVDIEGTAGCILDGDISGGGGDVRLWGTVAITDFTFLPTNRVVKLNDDGAGANHASVTVDTSVTVDSWQEEDSTGNTLTIIDAGSTLEIAAGQTSSTTHSIGQVTNNGTFIWNPTVGNQTFTMNALIQHFLASSWTINPGAVSGITLDGNGNALRLRTGTPSLSIKGTDLINAVALVDIQFTLDVGTQEFDFTVWSSTGPAIVSRFLFLNGPLTGSINHSRMIGNLVSGVIEVTTGNNPDWTVTNCHLENTLNQETLKFNDGMSNFTMKDCIIISNGGSGIQFNGTSFRGLIRNCTISGTGNGLSITAGIGADLGSFINCTFATTVPIFISSGNLIELIGCIFDETAITATGTGQVISHLHNRENNKTLFIDFNLTLDSTLNVIVNADTFDWDWVVGEWDINGSQEFESASATTTSMKSIFIPVSSSTNYYARFKGTLGSDGLFAAILQEFELDQVSTQPTHSFTQNGDIFEVSFTTDPETIFLQWILDASVGGLTFFDIEIREGIDNTGILIFNEDLLNEYVWATGVDFVDNEIQFDSTERLVIFGDPDYNQLDAEMIINGIGGADFAGFIFGWQDALNFYRALLTSLGVSIQKIVDGGTPVTIDTATTAGGVGIPVGDNIKFRVTWNDAAPGSFRVFINDTVIEGAAGLGDWTNASALDFTDADTTFTVGRMGFIGSSVSLENVIVKHDCFFLRDVDLILGAGAILTQTENDCFDYKRGTVNSTRGSFDDGGFTFIEEAVTWLENNFDEFVDSIQNITCTPKDSPVKISSDIILGINGKLSIIGGILEAETRGNTYTIITEGSTVTDPLDIRTSFLRNLDSRFRPLDLANGGPFRTNKSVELFVDGNTPEKPVIVISHEIFGRASTRNIPRTHGDKTARLEFQTRDRCLYSKLRTFMDNDVLLEVVYPLGYMPSCYVDDLFESEVFVGLGASRFTVILRERR